MSNSPPVTKGRRGKEWRAAGRDGMRGRERGREREGEGGREEGRGREGEN